jgi:hypothetical protein
MPLQTCQDSEKCYYNLSIHSCASEILQNWNRAIDITFSIHLFFFFLFFFIPSSSRTDERRVAAGPASDGRTSAAQWWQRQKGKGKG